jgi:ADP-heptose:LPS heptosyltransferase
MEKPNTRTGIMEIVFHITPNSTGDKRRWNKFDLLADYLIDNHKADIIFVGVDKDKEYIESVIEKIKNKKKVFNLVGVTTLDGLSCVLKYCDLLVCVNSFVMHLGVCLGTKMLAIVGATPPLITLPPNVPHLYSEYCKDIELESVIDAIKEIVK